jgi:hypothetical protein
VIASATAGEPAGLMFMKYAALAAIIYFAAAALLVFLLSKERKDRFG